MISRCSLPPMTSLALDLHGIVNTGSNNAPARCGARRLGIGGIARGRMWRLTIAGPRPWI